MSQEKQRKWKYFDLTQSRPSYFTDDMCNTCVYALEYNAHLGYGISDANQLIFNFKKPPSRKNQKDWSYKTTAILEFANALHGLFANRPYYITIIPTSKKREHENYDSRMEDTLQKLLELGKGVYTHVCPIINNESIKSASTENGPRDPETIYENYIWNGFQGTAPATLIVIDDVVTSGGHYVAYRRMLLEHYPEMKVYGVFWAKSI